MDAEIQVVSPDLLPDLTGLDGTDAGVEIEVLRQGEPWVDASIAGLQFYDYGLVDELTGEPLIPAAGDRLSLVREPENPHDADAVEVWWRNGIRLGHLPRRVAAEIAGQLDAGVALRAYVAHGGDGEAWSARALLVGPAAEAFHGRYIRHVVDAAFWRWEEGERSRVIREDRPSRERAQAFAREQARRRETRLLQAVNTLARAPFEIEPPPVGAAREVYAIQAVLGCSRSTAFKIARGAGVEPRLHYRGWYCDAATVEFTPELVEAMQAWAAAPRTRLTRQSLR
ncbi:MULTISPECIES: HIRAN domain-containing protein [unclassified Methylobacterium]|uniref:HIRAN domain-containing protein n=1 Tax=unclassified Methylobacterium TaxID=2615210 RepID=UPI00068CF768|nr:MULTISPECIES: HIRAN domain-containing protein [unclassified Methylobacterium]SFU51808.1 HIRAN domain-containing protein [Methylobacterium sp. UNCCL125]